MDKELPHFNPEQIDYRQGSTVPQWRHDQAIYFVTFRLADSLPKHVITAWDRHRRDWLLHTLDLETAKSLSTDTQDPLTLDVNAALAALSETDHHIYQQLFTTQWHRFLDAGHGECILKRASLREEVVQALLHFEGTRYQLSTSVVMPNHVHVLVRPLTHTLSQITHSWKSFSAKTINKQRSATGSVWQRESYNRIVRSQKNLECYIRYILDNPNKANLPASAYSILKP